MTTTSRELSATEAWRRFRDGRLRLIDIRNAHERYAGAPPGAEHVPAAELARQLDPGADRDVVLVCQRGLRSARAVAEAGPAGISAHWFSLAGGMEAWQAARLPLELPESQLDSRQQRRYLRHLPLEQVGEAGQRKLLDARVLIIGAGGLGSPAALYLAAAGVGRIGLVDGDVVELSNLQRQILHDDAQVGRPKTETGAGRLKALNPDIQVDTHQLRLDADNVDSIARDYHVIVDGSDNFPTKYLLNDACIRLGKPLVYGAVLHFAGHVSVFTGGDGHSPCYRCLFPEAPDPEDAPNCATAGVLGVIPGVIGCLQATEVVKLVLGIGRPLIGRLLQFDALAGGFRESLVERDPQCRWCDPARR